MKVVVYFETPKVLHAEVVATFDSEELYQACFGALEHVARQRGMIVSESVRENDYLTDKFEDEPNNVRGQE